MRDHINCSPDFNNVLLLARQYAIDEQADAILPEHLIRALDDPNDAMFSGGNFFTPYHSKGFRRILWRAMNTALNDDSEEMTIEHLRAAL